MFGSVLVANRGEIAVRITRACRELGIRAVAVYSEADRLSPHVLEADEAVLLGPAPAARSYLDIDRILDAARRTGADAVHPGYGFLAEREPFATAVEAAGITFIGPRPSTIGEMGDKTRARSRMQEAGIPIVPGLTEPVESPDAAVEAAHDIGYPLLLKASAGGGGKGMRVVASEADLPRAFEGAVREASAAFGDGSVYLERYLDSPRHVEIQLLADEHGTVLHLGERECSIQRRHQKLVEEAPSAVLSPREREAMGEAAVRAGRAVGYRGAGTVEFLYQDGDFHFLEMNTRLQVEHPVTELVTGIDIVEWQLRIAAGEPLPWGQDEIRIHGHAVECRITSENPAEGFLPSTGTVDLLEIPSGPGIRWDGGIGEGVPVGLNYDPLLGKLVAHGSDREAAIRRMHRALGELVIDGIDHCGAFQRRVMEERDFADGALSIRYLDEHPELLEAKPEDEMIEALAIAAALLEDHERETQAASRISGNGPSAASAWRAAGFPGAPRVPGRHRP